MASASIWPPRWRANCTTSIGSAAFFDIIHQDPTLSQVKLIAEPWDVGEGGYQVGNFPVLWAEWNGKYRDTVRRYWKGDDGQLCDLAYRLTGSSDLYQHDGRTSVRQHQFRHRARWIHSSATWSATTRSTTKRTAKITRRHKRQSLLEHGRRRTHRRSVDHRSARSGRSATCWPRCFFSQGVPMICGGDETGAHATRQQQRLLPGQRDQLVRLEPRPACANDC